MMWGREIWGGTGMGVRKDEEKANKLSSQCEGKMLPDWIPEQRKKLSSIITYFQAAFGQNHSWGADKYDLKLLLQSHQLRSC